MVLNIVLILIFIIVVAFLWNEGMWSNALSLINSILAGLIATNFFEPVASYLEGFESSYTYFWDYLALWGLFGITYGLLRAITDSISKVRVRFKMPVEQAGRVVFALATAWVFVCFATMALHTAPLAQTALRGSFGTSPTARYFFGTAPDIAWLGFVQNASRGVFSQPDEGAVSSNPLDQGLRVFDPRGEFVLKYGTRRKHLSEETTMRVRK